jgi:hypothetical protein
MTDQGRKEAITKQVRMVRYREQSVRDCVDNIESMIEALKQGQTLPIDSVSGSFSATDVERAYDDGYSTDGEVTFDINNYS